MSAAPGEALRPALALVNSRRSEPDGPVDDLDSPAAARAWLAGHGFEATGQVGDGALGAMRELRDAVRELLVARIEARVPAAGAVETVNAAAAAAPMAHRLVWSGSDAPRASLASVGASGDALARARLAADAIDLVTGPDHTDLRACGAPGCVRLLLKDHPRRRWCSTRCGDRVRAGRYYYRHHRAATP